MIGIDIESTARFERLIQKKPGRIRKLFYPYEWEYACRQAKAYQTLSGIWCAKEAVVKAFSFVGLLPITAVEIRHSENGVPYLFAVHNAGLVGKYNVHLSISHTRDCAAAVAQVVLNTTSH